MRAVCVFGGEVHVVAASRPVLTQWSKVSGGELEWRMTATPTMVRYLRHRRSVSGDHRAQCVAPEQA